jgi:hypothetical protein
MLEVHTHIKLFYEGVCMSIHTDRVILLAQLCKAPGSIPASKLQHNNDTANTTATTHNNIAMTHQQYCNNETTQQQQKPTKRIC